MPTLTRREAAALVSAGVVILTVGLPNATAADEKPLTPAEIVAKKFTGKATVEFTVGKSDVMVTGHRMKAGDAERLYLVPATPAGGTPALGVCVSWQVASRLKQLCVATRPTTSAAKSCD